MITGSFQSAIVTGVQQVPVSRLAGKTGKAVIFWGVGLGSDSATVFSAHSAEHRSFVIDSTNRENFCYFVDDGVTMNGRCDWRQVAISMIADGDGSAIAFEADSFAWVADTGGGIPGFQVSWTTAPGSAVTINYIILDSRDVQNAEIHQITLPAAASTTVSKTGMSFAPNAFFLMGRHDSVSPGARGLLANANYVSLIFGVAAGIGDEATFNGRTIDGQANSVHRYERIDRCFGVLSGSGVATEAQLTALAAGGYTLTTTAANITQRVVVVLAVKLAPGAAWNVVSATGTTADGGTQNITGYGFNPSWVLNFGGFHVANTTDQLADTDSGFGAYDGTTARNTQTSIRAGTGSRSHKRTQSSDILTHFTSADVQEAQADISALITDGVTLHWTNAATTARQIILLGGMYSTGVKSLISAGMARQQVRQQTRWY